MRMLAGVALSGGRLAAARYAKALRGDLGLSQQALADKAHVSVGAVQKFEAGKTWPNADTLARLERLGLNLVVGHLTEYAAKHREREGGPSTLDDDIRSIMESNLHPDLKLRLIDTLRSIDQPPTSEELEARITGLRRRFSPGEGESREDLGVA